MELIAKFSLSEMSILELYLAGVVIQVIAMTCMTVLFNYLFIDSKINNQ